MPFTKNVIARFQAWQATGCCQSDARPSGEADTYYLVCKITGKRINIEECEDCPYKETVEKGDSMEQLENCPFCGSVKLKTERKFTTTHFSRNRGLDHVVCSVRCNKCHARGGTASGYTRNAMYTLTEEGAKLLEPMAQIEARAIAAWNRRAEDGKSDG